METPHILVIPYPALGHAIPLMELSSCLLKHGFQITFVNMEFNHRNAMDVLASKEEDVGDRICLVSVPDGIGSTKERKQPEKIYEAILQTMPGKVEELVEDINESKRKMKCLIADQSLGYALEIAKNIHQTSFALSCSVS